MQSTSRLGSKSNTATFADTLKGLKLDTAVIKSPYIQVSSHEEDRVENGVRNDRHQDASRRQ